MSRNHIVKSYDEEIKKLNNSIIELGGLVEEQVERAIKAIVERDTNLAYKTIDDDDKIDDLNYEIDNQAVRLLALRQPMAQDLRNIVATFKLSSDLERIGDHATGIARRSIPLSEDKPIQPIHVIPRMGKLTMTMMKNCIDAYIEQNSEKAERVWNADKEVAEMYVSLFRELLTYMMEDAHHISACSHVLFIAKNIERIGDHVTNICETIYYMVEGERMQQQRIRQTKSDRLLTDSITEK